MIALPYDYFLVAWFVLAAGSTAYVAFDQFNGNPEPAVMWGFILVTLYMGPFGLLLYVLTDKEPRPGEHEQFTSPLWKQGIGSVWRSLPSAPRTANASAEWRIASRPAGDAQKVATQWQASSVPALGQPLFLCSVVGRVRPLLR